MNGYTLIRNWYNFKFSHPEKVRHVHSDFYCYLVDQWNRLGQKQNFGLPTSVTMEALQIGSYNTYKKTLQDLIDWGFVDMVKESRNQHTSKIIALSKNDKPTDKPTDKALDEATIKATDEPTDKPTDTIIEQYNNITKEQTNNRTNITVPTKVGSHKTKVLFSNLTIDDIPENRQRAYQLAKGFYDIFTAHANELELPKANLENADAMKWIREIELMIEKNEATDEQIVEVGKFLKTDSFWKPNVRSVPKLREKFENIYASTKKQINGKSQSTLDDPEFQRMVMAKMSTSTSGGYSQEV